MSKPKYEEEYRKKLKENFRNFDINEESVQLKIRNFCQKFPFNNEDVCEKISSDDVLKAWFIKDPSRQNIYENTFGTFLKNIKGVYNYKKLPNSGPNSTFIVNQTVKKKNEFENKPRSKSMDFVFKFEGSTKTFYVFHKYTKDPGGAQDNQRNDVLTAIEEASNPLAINEEIFVLFVCDGEYYKTQREALESKVKDLNFKLIDSSKLENFLKHEL